MGEGDDQYRGREGRLAISTSRWPNQIVDAFIASAVERGHPFNPDYNGAHQEGVGFYQSAIDRGRRASTATAFLRPARKRHGVDIRPEALVTSLLLAGRRSPGVTYRRAGVQSRVMAPPGGTVCGGPAN